MEAMLGRWLFVEDIELEQLRNYGWRHSGDVVDFSEFKDSLAQTGSAVNMDSIKDVVVY